MASANRSSSDNVVKVDPQRNRPANAEESVPEALVPDVVHTGLQSDSGAPDRWQRIARRAYELAQQRGFTPGAELSDWLQAEKEIDGSDKQAAPDQQTAPEDQFTG